MHWRPRAVVCARLLAASAWASADGRLEINQATVDAAGGFPFTISQTGSYVLTSNLTVPAATDGLVLDADHVHLDLNGFAVSGPSTCTQGSCSAGGGDGNGIITSGNRPATVRNGRVNGFERRCVSLGPNARVEDLHVFDCSLIGILVSSDSLVMRNLVHHVGDSGIHMSGTTSVFAPGCNLPVRSTSWLSATSSRGPDSRYAVTSFARGGFSRDPSLLPTTAASIAKVWRGTR